MEHRGDEAQLTAVSLDPLAPVGAGGAQRLLAFVGAALVVQCPRDERAGPRPLVVVPLLGVADVCVAHLEPVLSSNVATSSARVGKSSGLAPSACCAAADGRLLPDRVAEQGASTGAQVPPDGVERAVEPAESVARADADDRVLRCRGRCRPGGGIRLDPGEPVGDSAARGASFASGCRAVSTPTAVRSRRGLEQLEQPRTGTAAEVDDPAGWRRVQPREQPADHRQGHRGRDGVVGVGDAADLGAVHGPHPRG